MEPTVAKMHAGTRVRAIITVKSTDALHWKI